MATFNKFWQADFATLDPGVETPNTTELHALIADEISPTVLQSIDTEVTSPLPGSAGNFDIITDIALTGPQQTAVEAILDAHTGLLSGEGDGDTTLTVPDTVLVGHLVYLTGLDAADRADNGNGTTGSAVGIVTSKPTTTTARIKTSGEVGGLSGMTPSSMQFLGTNGERIEFGALPTATGSVWQELGVAVSPTVILLDIERPTVRS